MYVLTQEQTQTKSEKIIILPYIRKERYKGHKGSIINLDGHKRALINGEISERYVKKLFNELFAVELESSNNGYIDLFNEEHGIFVEVKSLDKRCNSHTFKFSSKEQFYKIRELLETGNKIVVFVFVIKYNQYREIYIINASIVIKYIEKRLKNKEIKQISLSEQDVKNLYELNKLNKSLIIFSNIR